MIGSSMVSSFHFYVLQSKLVKSSTYMNMGYNKIQTTAKAQKGIQPIEPHYGFSVGSNTNFMILHHLERDFYVSARFCKLRIIVV